ncbi:MAG TPA: glucose-6-phosphate isomerase [Rhodocyclaceae bacterium]
MNPLLSTPAWQALERHAADWRARPGPQVRELFTADPQRFERFALRWEGWLVDCSKQRIDATTLALLTDLWQAADVPGWIARMRSGEAINHTEGRAVLHHALRADADTQVMHQGRDVMPEIRAVLDRIEQFCARIHGGSWRGATNQPVRDVVNIGIGGSDLGPKMATRALFTQHVKGVRVHYVSNLDGAHLANCLKPLDPASTLFIVSSKTFATQETLQNAQSARQWIIRTLGVGAVARHFVAVSTNIAAAQGFGIAAENVFPFWDWVGGRFSVWSAIGLPLALAIGFENFQRLLAGGRSMDRHFFETPPERNLPALLALLEVWNVNFLGADTRAVQPYSQSLELLTHYLQQLEMESNGKQTGRDGTPVGHGTAPVVWGEAGTNGQHAFYQLIHQGGRLIPGDFIALREPDFLLPGHHEKLLANCFAQTEALMRGKTLDEAHAELLAGGASVAEAARLAPYKVFPGDQPTTTLLMPRLDPYTLGQLIALYEHKVFVLGVLWHLNSFDQWGVEYGKQLANRLLPALVDDAPVAGLDASTAGLIAACREKPRLTLIAAVASNGGIGKDNQLLWHLPEDMKFFRETTRGATVIMGRKTWESLPPRFRPLPGRRNIVVTRQAGYQAEGGEIAHGLDQALELAGTAPSFVIGGAELYALALPRAQRLVLTEVSLTPAADAYFPVFARDEWREVSRQPGVSENGIAYAFVTYEKI